MYFTNNYEQDLLLMATLLDGIEFYSGTERRNMLKKGNTKHPKDGGSMLYGYTWKGYLSPTKNRTIVADGVYQTKIMDDHPELMDLFKEFAFLYFPNFEWGSVQMNKNFQCPPHKDSKNIGESILVSCGDYIGGKTAVDYGNYKRWYNTRIAPLQFNGSKYTHWVEPYTKTRYSLVFFHNRSSRQYKNLLL